MTFDDIIRNRRSVRKLKPDPVPRADVLAILDAARWAPSPHGRMPWRFVLLTNPARKTALADAMGVEWRKQLSYDQQDAQTIALRAAKSHERITSAPAVFIPCLYTAELDVYPDAQRNAAEETMAIQSLGAMIQNALLTAYARGLDCGWMCAPLFCPTLVAKTLGLDPTFTPHALITIGYAAADPVRRPRKPLTELLVLDD